jgi:CPA2 family monovalent cation:H+ antiporter-2
MFAWWLVVAAAAASNAVTTEARRTSPLSFHRSVHQNSHGVMTTTRQSSSWNVVPRGGAVEEMAEEAIVAVAAAAATNLAAAAAAATTHDAGLRNVMTLKELVVEAVQGLVTYGKGTKSDALILLLTSALIPPLSKNVLHMSPILGFLANGILCGPNGMKWIQNVHATEHLADFGVVFFLFEMGIHLDFKTLWKMKRDVFGLGGSQFLVTAVAVAAIAGGLFQQSFAAMVVLGGGLALSSSAFVLQLLKDGDQLESDYGKTSFGVLLLQDLAVVPLLVAIPLLAGSGSGSLRDALTSAGLKAVMALGAILTAGTFLLEPMFDFCTKCQSQEALVGAILVTILGMSFLTEGLGLSNTLGAFLAGSLLSPTKYRHQIEREIAPFRGILVGLFFFTVGFEIDLQLIQNQLGSVLSVVVGLLFVKTVICTGVCLAFGKSLATSQQTGLILSQGGEFAFVAFRLARECGIFDTASTKFLLTCVSLTMATTPFLESLGGILSQKIQTNDNDNDNDDKAKLGIQTKKTR